MPLTSRAGVPLSAQIYMIDGDRSSLFVCVVRAYPQYSIHSGGVLPKVTLTLLRDGAEVSNRFNVGRSGPNLEPGRMRVYVTCETA